MKRRFVEVEILEALAGFERSGARLPTTDDGKVNVAALCRALGLNPTDAQHFHKKPPIKSKVNELARLEGLLPIGARLAQEFDISENVDGKRESFRHSPSHPLSRRRDRESAQAQISEIAWEELTAAAAEIERLTLENDALRARLRIAERGGVLPCL